MKISTKEYKLLGICTCGIQMEAVRDTVTAICTEATKYGYKCLIFNSFSDLFNDNEYTTGEASVFELVNAEMLDAIIMLPEAIKRDSVFHEIAAEADKFGTPIISVDYNMEGRESIVYNYSGAFTKIVRHVIEDHGCHRINILAGIKDNPQSDERIECIKRIMAENNIEFDPRRLGYGDFWEGPARKAVEGFYASGLPFPDAIICCNDSMAITACQVIREHGMKIPEDVIVTGFDGIELEKYTSPRLTTAAPDIELLSKKAIESVEKMRRGEKVPLLQKIPYHFRTAQSCGCEKIDILSVTDKILELNRIMNDTDGHESYMFSYQGNTVNCHTLDDIARVMSHYGDYSSWCNINMDFLDEKPAEKNGFFTDNMYNLMTVRGEDFKSGEIFPKSECLPNINKAIEENDYLMFMPLHFQDEIIGYMTITFGTKAFPFKNTRRFISNTNQILEAFKNRMYLQRANAKLEDMHMRDPMTGIYNRRGFYQYAQAIIERCNRTGEKMVLFSIDMDGLKQINDAYGHHEGDNAICTITRAMKEASVNGEICSRFGGDEFIVMGSTYDDKDYVKNFTNRLQMHINKIVKENHYPYEVKISCGTTAERCESIKQLDEFIRRADANMYTEKRMHKMLTGSGHRDFSQRMVDLLINKSSMAFFYINYEKNIWQIGETEAAPSQIFSDKYNPVNAIEQSSAVVPDDRPLFSDFAKKLRESVSTPIHDNNLKIQFRMVCGDKPEWYNLVLTLFKNDDGLTSEVIGSINSMSEHDIIKRNVLNFYTNDRNPAIFASMMENRLRNDLDHNYAVVQFDVVKFKLINDTYGEPLGTELLHHFNDVLNVYCSDEQLYTRLSADVFMIVTPYEEIKDINDFIRGLEKCLLGYKDMKYSFAWGVYLVKDRNISSRLMGDSAGIARMNIKGNALENVGYYQESQKDRIRNRKEIEDNMKSALENNEFVMFLQPKYSISTNVIIGAEALVRWDKGAEGLIPPSEFIPIFEENGFVVKLDEYIWECACKLLKKWADMGHDPIHISVNVSRVHLKNLDFLDHIENLVKKYGIEKDWLELEITETIENINANRMVKEAKKHGFTLLMDDFGSGYSSLNTLKSTPFDVLKIDRSFLNSFMESDRGKKIISHTIAMSKDIGLDLIAEGVENKDQAEFLSDCGCDAAQGFYYSKPVPVSEFEKLLAAQQEK